MLLSDYLKSGYSLEEHGVFDLVLEEDSHFFAFCGGERPLVR